MRIAAISDIHSNVYALQAVLADIKKRGVDQIVNLGDILYGSIAPKETYELLMEHDFITINGNEDRKIHQASAVDIAKDLTLEFVLQDLPAAALDWMKQLPYTYQLTEQVLLCHGTPSKDDVYLLERIAHGSSVVRADDDILAQLKGETSPVILCGHSHKPRTVLTSTGQLIVNAGSVGLQAYMDDEPFEHVMENFSPHASYVILEQANDQTWSAQHYKVAYDYEKAAKDADNNGKRNWGFALRTGRSPFAKY